MATRNRFLPFVSALGGMVLSGMAFGQDVNANRAEIVHVLNRITFGPRPGDVEMVQKMGLNNYIEQQLHPEAIDDTACDKEAAKFALLQMTTAELVDIDSGGHKAAKAGGGKKAAKQQELADSQSPGQDMTMQSAAQPSAAAQNAAMLNEAMQNQPMQSQAQQSSAPGKMAPSQDEAVDLKDQWRPDAAIGQLEQAKLVRAIDSERQLQEVLVDFWSNHFNIDVKKKTCTVTKIIDDRDVIRAHIWGKFHDLLEASAKSPAMLFYLDNALSVADLPSSGNELAAKPKGKDKGGLNENYGREIMELHTLGVDAGYTQKDVQEVARCFTGWSVDKSTGEFAFHAALHDNGEKTVLGHVIPANGGMQDGETVLNLLCVQPACAHHIALQMCQRFVSDNPPPALVDHIADVFSQSDGDLRKVTEAILTSPEFLSPANYNNKIKSPFEFSVSAIRATESTIVAQQPPPYDKIIPLKEGRAILGKSSTVSDRMDKQPHQSLNWHIYELGEPLFACTPPTGYKEVSTYWVSPGALIERLNFALALTGQGLSDVRFDPRKILGGVDLDKPDAVLNQCVAALLQNNISDPTRKVLEKMAIPAAGENKTVNPAELIALIIGSPEFQRK